MRQPGKGDFNVNIQGNSYRFDPEALFDRNPLSC